METENFSKMQHLPSIRDYDRIVTATGEGKVPFVSADDIAAVAFRALMDPVPHNTDHLILGPALFSYDEVAEMISDALGRKITHIKTSEAELARSFGAFVPGDYANMLAGMDSMIKRGAEERTNEVVEETTGQKPRTLESFVSQRVEMGVWVKQCVDGL
jgi:festuclavine dehydrogenase